MRTSESGGVAPDDGAIDVQRGDRATEQAVYLVNKDRQGRVDPRGEDLKGAEILSRVGLNAEKYELWTVVGGTTDEAIGPDQTWHVKPGDHFRATIRGTDYSFPRRQPR